MGFFQHMFWGQDWFLKCSLSDTYDGISPSHWIKMSKNNPWTVRQIAYHKSKKLFHTLLYHTCTLNILIVLQGVKFATSFGVSALRCITLHRWVNVDLQFKISNYLKLMDISTLKMRPLHCHETSGHVYWVMQHHIYEAWLPQLHCITASILATSFIPLFHMYLILWNSQSKYVFRDTLFCWDL